MSWRVAVAIHWFLLASAVVFPGVLAKTSKQHPKDLSEGNRWNAAPKNSTTPWKVESEGNKSQRIATYKENLRSSKRGQRSLLLESDFENLPPVYSNPNPNPNPYSNPIAIEYPNKSGYPDVGTGLSSIGNGYPITGNGLPNAGNSAPGIGNGYPGTGNSYPGTGNGLPNAGNTVPGIGNGYPGTGNGYPGTGNGYPGTGTSYSSTGNGLPNIGSSVPGIGNGYPGTGNGLPNTGNTVPGIGNGYPGTGNGYPGTGNGYPGTGGYPGIGNGLSNTGNSVPGIGNGYPGIGNGYPGTGNGFPGSGNPYSGSGTGFPVFPQLPPQLGFPTPQSGNPGNNNWYPGSQNGYQSPISGFSPFSAYVGNATLAGNTPYPPPNQYQPPLNPMYGDTAPYPQPNIPNIDASLQPYGAQPVSLQQYGAQPVQPNFPQNLGAYPGYSPYNGFDLSPVQGLPPSGVMPNQNPQGLGSPGIGVNPHSYANFPPCQILCCLLSVCHLFALPPCTSCENVQGIQAQPQNQIFASSSADASSPKVITTSGREVGPSKIVIAPTKDVPLETKLADSQPSLTPPEPLDTSRNMPSPTSDTAQKLSSNLNPENSPSTTKTSETLPDTAKEGNAAAIAGIDLVLPTAQLTSNGPDKSKPKSSTNVLSEPETPPQSRQASAPTLEQPQPPPIPKAVRSLEATPPPQPSLTSEKIEPRMIVGTRSLI